MEKGGWVYILANRPGGVLYTGVSAQLVHRIAEDRMRVHEGFTAKYGVTMLVYFERHDEILGAIAREKTVKRWRRAWKIALIETENPGWEDLWFKII